jgi:transcriptional regulator with XRE-family HTH domain
MPVDEDEGIGARIRDARKMRHLSQLALAQAAHVSQETISKVERGARQPSPAVVAALARALSVPVTDLTGQPYLRELRREQLDGLIQPIREALDVYDLGSDPEIQPRDAVDLAAEASRMCGLVRAADLRTVAAELPGLITEMTTAAHLTGSDKAWSTLASSYRSAYDISSKLGFFDLAAIALDRMSWAAERGSDPVMAAVRQYLRSVGYLRAGQYRTGRRLADIGQQTAALAGDGSARAAVAGQLHLGAAVLAARDQDREEALGHIEAARRLADETGEITRVHWLTFGPTNVAVHPASVLVEQDEYAQARAVARTINIPADWPVSRAAHHRAEVARAFLFTGHTDQAFRALLSAKRLAPQQSRYSPTVRETMQGVRDAKRQLPEAMTQFAAWLGI